MKLSEPVISVEITVALNASALPDPAPGFRWCGRNASVLAPAGALCHPAVTTLIVFSGGSENVFAVIRSFGRR